LKEKSNIQEEEVQKIGQKEGKIFYCKQRGAKAKMIWTDTGFIVLKNSIVSAKDDKQLKKYHNRYKILRDRLIETKILQFQEKIDAYLLMEDQEFKSSSAAAQFVTATHANGYTYWKTEEEKELGEFINPPEE
jgi:Domain of unknown function (DUF4357)